MPPNQRTRKAYKAMKDIGIDVSDVKPVLNDLLKLYDRKWAHIEAENYRVLADAIFEMKSEVQYFFHFLFYSLFRTSIMDHIFLNLYFRNIDFTPYHMQVAQNKESENSEVMRLFLICYPFGDFPIYCFNFLWFIPSFFFCS